MIDTYDFEGNPIKAIVINDFEITNPFISECGRFDVNPIEYYGLTQEQVSQLTIANNILEC